MFVRGVSSLIMALSVMFGRLLVRACGWLVVIRNHGNTIIRLARPNACAVRIGERNQYREDDKRSDFHSKQLKFDPKQACFYGQSKLANVQTLAAYFVITFGARVSIVLI